MMEHSDRVDAPRHGGAARRRGVTFLALLVTMAFTAQACSSDSKSTTTSATATTVAATTTAAASTATTEPAGASTPDSGSSAATTPDTDGATTTAASGEEPKGSFSVAVGEPDHLTPGRQTIAYDQVPPLFASLTRIGTDGTMTYLQAESVTSPDATVWTIKLRSGWTFHNGEPVTAQSFVDAWNATAYGPNAWGDNGEMVNIVGYDDLNPKEGEPTTKTMSGLKVVDDLTIEVTLKGADSQFPLQLTQGQTGFYPMPKAAFDDLEAYDKAPIGNGPFEIDGTWEANEPITEKAYADYKGTKPKAAEIVFKSYSDPNTGYTDVIAGNTDMQFLPASKLTQAKADFGDRLYAFPAPGVEYLGIPLDDPRFKDVRIRQAISMSIDRDAISKAIFGGFYTPTTSLTPSAEVGSPTGICEFCKFDPTAAKALLAEAGGWTGPMVVWFPGGIGQDELFTAIANQIRQNLGIADVTTKSTADFSEYASLLTDKKVDGPHFGHWGALYPSMQNTLRNLYTAAGGCQICTTYSSPDVDAILAKADAAPTADAANALYVEAQKRILQDFPTVPLLDNQWVYGTSERLSNIVAAAGVVDVTQVVVTD
jgi:ABC-type transport system substrate-binding protein